MYYWQQLFHSSTASHLTHPEFTRRADFRAAKGNERKARRGVSYHSKRHRYRVKMPLCYPGSQRSKLLAFQGLALEPKIPTVLPWNRVCYMRFVLSVQKFTNPSFHIHGARSIAQLKPNREVDGQMPLLCGVIVTIVLTRSCTDGGIRIKVDITPASSPAQARPDDRKIVSSGAILRSRLVARV